MKAISILGTSSNAGKSWMATALCSWLRQQGVNVAPFKSQNMSNNAYATLEGGEIGVAQAVQAEACGRRPIAEMNPILLKPSGDSRSQLVRMGSPVAHIAAKDYYQTLDKSWQTITHTLDHYWPKHCDVLVMEGAGSPVELNLMERDIANLKPIRHVQGKWILVADIERGGIFPQVIGTWNLLPTADQANGLGFIVNKFRGDPELFANAAPHFQRHTPLTHLGTLPLTPELYIDDEDSLVTADSTAHSRSNGNPTIAWIRFPRLSNSQDQLPWIPDSGIQQQWTISPNVLQNASAIILPGTKDTLADLQWLKEIGLAALIQQKASSGTPIIGICGGYQMLGKTISDPSGHSGTAASVNALGLLPHHTVYSTTKTVTRQTATHSGANWETYEIHMGQTSHGNTQHSPLIHIQDSQNIPQPEGIEHNKIWGTYQHGLFDHPSQRQRLINLIGGLSASVTISPTNWKQHRTDIYDAMGNALEQHLNLDPIKAYLNL